MSAEPSQITNTEVWTQWEGKLVNGVFPLRRLLGGSGHSGVFLTEQGPERTEVAIKFVPANTVQAEAQLVRWGATTTLLHPNLVRIFDVGRYRADGRDYLYVVQEFADQTLAEILPRRPLADEEVRELLLPTLDALIFLHRKGLIHGRLRPSNFLAVNDRLKISSDTIRPIDHTASGSGRASPYDAPELNERGMNAAADIWSLGMTLLESLTQRTTAWPDETVSLPADLPAPFGNVVAKCLSIAPAARPTVLDIEAQFKAAATAQAAPADQPRAAQSSQKITPPRRPQQQNPLLRALSAAVPLSVIAWAGWQVLDRAPDPAPPAPEVPAPQLAAPAPATVAKRVEPTPAPVAKDPAPAVAAPASPVLHEVTPDLSPAAREKIRGRMHVTVRVLVDAEGNVVGTLMEQPGPSKYLAGLAERAAEEWKFTPEPKQDSRVWLVYFVFSRDGVTSRAIAQ